MLQTQIKSKVAGQEGNFEQLLVRAHFEEAKIWDLTETAPKPCGLAEVSRMFSPASGQRAYTPREGQEGWKDYPHTRSQ